MNSTTHGSMGLAISTSSTDNSAQAISVAKGAWASKETMARRCIELGASQSMDMLLSFSLDQLSKHLVYRECKADEAAGVD